MTPTSLAKSGTEHGEQTALFAWCAMATNYGFVAANDERSYKSAGAGKPPHALTMYGTAQAVPELRWFYAIPNGGSRGDTAKSAMIRGSALKAEGVKSGVADTFLPVSRCGFGGLYIEMKRPSERPKCDGRGGLSDEQVEFSAFVTNQNFAWRCCYTWQEAAHLLELYIKGLGVVI